MVDVEKAKELLAEDGWYFTSKQIKLLIKDICKQVVHGKMKSFEGGGFVYNENTEELVRAK